MRIPRLARGARRGDFWSGLALAGLGTYIATQARAWDYVTADGPGAGFFPLWYGLAMIGLSLWLVLASVRGATHDPGVPPAASRGVPRALTCWAAFVVAIAVLRVLGFVVTLALLAWFIVAVLFGERQRTAWLVAIAGTAIFYLVFAVALGLDLPPGALFS